MTRIVEILNEGQIKVTITEEVTKINIYDKVILEQEKQGLEFRITEINDLLLDFIQ